MKDVEMMVIGDLVCLEKSLPYSVDSFHSSQPLGSSLPGHPLVLIDGPDPPLGHHLVPRAHLMQLA